MPSARLRPTLALVALLTLVTLPALPVSADATVTDPGNRFSFQLPDSWQTLPGVASVADADATVLACRTTNPDGSFSVLTSPVITAGGNLILNPGTTFDPVQGLPPGVQIQDVADVTVAGEAGRELDFTSADSAGTIMAQQQLFVAHNGTVYMLTFGARPEDIDTVRAAGASILTSWQWLG